MERKQSASDEPINVEQESASEVSTTDNKISGKTSDGNRKICMVEFVSDDSKSFSVEENVAKKLFPNKITEQVLESDESISVQEIDPEILTIMIKWAEKHVNDPETSNEAEAEDEDDDDKVKKTIYMEEWDKELLDLKVETLFRLADAARFMQMECFLNVVLKKLASLIKGKSRDEIREAFNLPAIEGQTIRKHEEN